MAKARSARGVEVDFDTLRIKEQLAESPAPLEVKAREDFVDQRLKRRARRKAQQAAQALAAKEQAAEESVVEDVAEIVPEPIVKDEPVTSTARKQKTPKRKKQE